MNREKVSDQQTQTHIGNGWGSNSERKTLAHSLVRRNVDRIAVEEMSVYKGAALERL